MITAIGVAAAFLATPVPPPADPLTTEIGALDARIFDAYNRCDLPTFSSYFDPKVACLIPAFDGASSAQAWKDALWDRFYMGAPARQRRSVERYSIVKKA